MLHQIRKITLATFACLLAVGSTPAIAQQTLNVPSMAYPTIQSAIAAAQTNDTVLVAPGVYNETPLFFGRDITVRSTHGPEVTEITKTVKILLKETRQTLLEGFTITGGGTSGLFIEKSSPTIRNCIIRNAKGPQGGGIYISTSSSPLIENCQILDNQATIGFGGGLYSAFATPVLRNCVIAGNTAGPMADGGGVYGFQSNIALLNCTIYDNTATAQGGGVYLFEAPATIMNSIIRENNAQSGNPEIVAVQSAVTATYSNVKGGWTGAGNFDAVSMFANASAHDYHLMAGSPNIDKGNAAAILAATDMDGDPRQFGSSPDVGADEWYLHVYYTGTATPGQQIVVKVTGAPSAAAAIAVSQVQTPRTMPLTIPNVGDLYLQSPFTVASLGAMPANGIAAFPVSFPGAFPVPQSFPIQALVGGKLTNLKMIHVR